MPQKKVILLNLIDGTGAEAKSLAKAFAEAKGFRGYKFTVVAGRKIEAFFGVLSDEWKQKAKLWLQYVDSPIKYSDRPEYDNQDGIKLILEALLSQ